MRLASNLSCCCCALTLGMVSQVFAFDTELKSINCLRAESQSNQADDVKDSIVQRLNDVSSLSENLSSTFDLTQIIVCDQLVDKLNRIDDGLSRENPRTSGFEVGLNSDAVNLRNNEFNTHKVGSFQSSLIGKESYQNVAGALNGVSIRESLTSPSYLSVDIVNDYFVNKDSVSEKRVDLYWYDDADNEDQMIIERCKLVVIGQQQICRFEPLANVAADVTSFTDHPGFGQFKYRIKAINATQSSDYSNVVGI